MTLDRSISEEHLNAFVDNQLDADEKSRILGAINSDEDLSRRACEVRRLHELVQHAYDYPPRPAREHLATRRVNPWIQGVAAMLLLALGALIGWVGHGQRAPEAALQTQAMYLDEEKAFQTASIAEAPVARNGRKILLHLSSGDPQKIEEALNTAEGLLRTYRAKHLPVEVELVANAGGLNLLRADVSPFADRVRALQEEFENITFLACQTAMNRLLQREHMDNPPPLLPEALITPNALEEILTRLQEGWVYVSV